MAANRKLRYYSARFTQRNEETLMKQKKEYKMVLSSDGNFSGKTDRLTWEHVLNAFAAEGWVVVSANNANFSKSSVGPGELVVLLERDKA